MNEFKRTSIGVLGVIAVLIFCILQLVYNSDAIRETYGSSGWWALFGFTMFLAFAGGPIIVGVLSDRNISSYIPEKTDQINPMNFNYKILGASK